MTRLPQWIGQVMRFILVGVFNTLVDLGILNLLILVARTPREGLWFSIFKTGSFLVALLSSYLLNRFWVFRKKAGGQRALEVSSFVIISVGGALINVGIATLIYTARAPVEGFFLAIPLLGAIFAWVVGLVSKVAADGWGTIATMLAIAVSMVWNFLGYKFIVFRKKEDHGAGTLS